MTALALKATVVMTVALLAVVAAARTRASVRHMILASLFAFLLLLPAAQSLAPALSIPVRGDTPLLARALAVTAPATPAVPAPATPAEAAPQTTDWRTILTRGYFAIAGILLLSLAAGVWRLRRLAHRGEVSLDATAAMNALASACGIRRPALVVFSDEVAVPMTFGFRTSTIVLPMAAAEWKDDELGRALRHELEHVRRDDWMMQLIARAACALYWPHPLVWVAWRRFCLEAERACDDAVIGTFSAAEAYAGQLVTLAREVRRMTTLPALGMASRSKLAARVEALLDPAQRRGPLGGVATSFALGVTLLFLVTIAPARVIAAVEPVGEVAEVKTPTGAQPAHYVDRSPLGKAFVESAAEGLTEDVGRMIGGGVDVNLIKQGDGTALIAAARGGYSDTVLLLLENGADVNLASPGDGNPLIAASRRGHANVVELLLEFGADIDAVVPGDENPLIQAAWHGQAEVVALLIARGANVNARAMEGEEVRTPLRMAARGRHHHIERMLRAAGARD